jgi:hypothetical protein
VANAFGPYPAVRVHNSRGWEVVDVDWPGHWDQGP